MKTLIDVDRAYALAFSREETYGVSVLTEVDIVEAETRFVRPLLGDALYEALARGVYVELMDEYVAPAVALWTRYVVEPHLATRCCGCLSSQTISQARNENDRRAYRALHAKAAALSRRLTVYLNGNKGNYPEYDPKNNFLNRSMCYGNLV